MADEPKIEPSPHLSFKKLNRQVGEVFQFFDTLDANQVSQEIREQLQKRQKRLLSSLQSTRRAVREKIREKRTSLKQNVKRQLRQAIVGDPDGSIRKFVHEPPQVKLLDKACFTFSLIHVGLSEYVVLARPEFFHLYFLVMSVALMTFRYVDYKTKQWHYFMIDLCYFVNFLALVQSVFFYEDPLFFEMLFVLANGPVLWGIVIWRNSMVFHSVDKMTSLFLHSFPPLYTYCHRWLISPERNVPVCVEDDCSLTWTTMIWYFSVIYITWQILYLIKTEIIDRSILESNSELQTSVRWLINDSKNFMTISFTKFFRRSGVLGKDEVLDPTSIKGKILFFVVMALYSLVTAIPAKFLFQNQSLHLGCFLFAFLCSMFNGANYYVEVFSARYMKDLGRKAQEMEQKYDALRRSMEDAVDASLVDPNQSDLDTDTEEQ